MGRFILLLAAVALVWWWLSSRRKSVRSEDPAKKAPVDPAGARQMVSCAHCGVHLPQADALSDAAAGVWYCSEEHRLLGPGPVEKP